LKQDYATAKKELEKDMEKAGSDEFSKRKSIFFKLFKTNPAEPAIKSYIVSDQID
jgi:hypothetical protein